MRWWWSCPVLCICAWNAVDAAITGALVTLNSLNAGATDSVDVEFTTGLTTPVDGALVVIFPSNFYIASTSLSNPNGIDLASTATVSGTSVTIAVVNNALPPGPISFTLSGVTSPGEGTTGRYGIRTLDTSGTIIEAVGNVAASVLTRTTLTTAGLTFSTLAAGAAAQFTVSLRTDVLLRVGSLIELQFPTMPSSNFVYTGAVVAARDGLDPASTVIAIAPPRMWLTIAGQDVAADTPVSVTFGNIFYPAAQPVGTFTIRTRHSSGGILQDMTGVAGPVLASTALDSSATVQPNSYLGGMVTTYAVRFSNTAYLPIGAKIAVVFPPRFKVSAATLGAIINIPAPNAVFSVSGSTLTLTLGSGPTMAGSGRSFTVANIVNPGTSCNKYDVIECSVAWETYSITIMDAANNVYEQSATVPGTPIVKKSLAYARVRPFIKLPNTVTTVTLSMDTQAEIPINGLIELVLPTGYTIGATAPSAYIGIPLASTNLVIAGLQASLTVAGSSILPTTGISLTLSAVTTPNWWVTGMYILRTRDALGNIMEEHDKLNGEGCPYLNDCNGHGTCTLFSWTCMCESGWGALTDIADYRAPDCTMRTCPSGLSWTSIPTGEETAHDVQVECSGMGACDRSTGSCVCIDGFTGAACERMTCPNDCYGRGKCVSMKEMATIKTAFPLSPPITYTGATSTTTWDENRVFGCVCDSSWAVGTGAGEIQASEYFGPDCSLRRCPSGDDPETLVDETDCNGKTAPGGIGVGDPGNLCYVECSNRGICNYRKGICTCFTGYSGNACQTKKVDEK
ncbi:hypothetical protein Poli38472_003366 [Pythium oligandrum]|uniref:EGF-like domain-containing protein n=1 Tax=Pythium oligandrum TaxID=41045 RepID=A0A8K1C6E0_PYTOL|nr:hypothetical protein Poli38472_003366 [Pythium oligandrum]|eukprot:TMW57441.1 hypothetical protein Poli38472_003366 [Pythium oligandrum]